MRKHIPLTISQILDSTTNLYVRLKYYREYIDYQTCTLDSNLPKTITTYFNAARLGSNSGVAVAAILGIARKTWSAHKDKMPPLTWVVLPEERFSLMPFSVFDAFVCWLDEKSSTLQGKDALLRMYCYLYFNCSVYQDGFQLSQEQMAIELGTSLKLVNSRIKLLRDAGWIERRGTYKFTGDKTWCYKYVVPEHLKPSEIF